MKFLLGLALFAGCSTTPQFDDGKRVMLTCCVTDKVCYVIIAKQAIIGLHQTQFMPVGGSEFVTITDSCTINGRLR